MTQGEMAELVAEWDAAVLDAADALGWWGTREAQPRSTVLRPPATEEAVEALERRIGRRLPPSYRAFLQISDGADAKQSDIAGPGEGLVRADEVAWFIDGRRLSNIFASMGRDGWADFDNDPQWSELEWLVACFLGGSAEVPPNYLTHCLAISPLLEHSAVLLNPLVQDVDGEWQCVSFDTHDAPAAYRSFAEYVWRATEAARGFAARVEGRDLADLDEVDDVTVARWLTEYAIAPTWFTRAVRGENPPERAVEILRTLLATPKRNPALQEITQMASDAALSLAKAAWRTLEDAEASGRAEGRPLGRDAASVLGRLASARDERVRAWVADTLADHGDRPVDADVRLHLQSLSPAVVGLLRERPGAAPLVAAMVTGGFWLSAADLEDLARRRLSDLADDAWRAAHPGEVDRAVGQAYRLGAEAAPTLRRLEGVEGVNQESLALALLRTGGDGDGDVDFIARRLPLPRIEHLTGLPVSLVERYRERRFAHLSARSDLTVTEINELSDGDEARAAEALLARHPSERPGEVARQLEYLRTGAAIEALARLVPADPYALRALARLGDDRCVPGLLALLAVDDPDARAFAARGIRDLGRPEPVARLVEAAVDDTEDDVAWIAAHAAVVAGVEATALLDQLGAASDDAARLVEHWRTKVAAPEESRGPVVS